MNNQLVGSGRPGPVQASPGAHSVRFSERRYRPLGCWRWWDRRGPERSRHAGRSSVSRSAARRPGPWPAGRCAPRRRAASTAACCWRRCRWCRSCRSALPIARCCLAAGRRRCRLKVYKVVIGNDIQKREQNHIMVA